MNPFKFRSLTALAVLFAMLLTLLPGCGKEPVPSPASPDSGAVSSDEGLHPGEDAISSDAVSSGAVLPDVPRPDAEEVLNPTGEETYGPVETDETLNYRLVNGKFYEVIGIKNPKSPKSVIEVPAVFNGKPVMRVQGAEDTSDGFLGTGALGGTRPTILSVKFSEGVVDIGRHAFGGEDNLQKVTLPASLQRLGEAPFNICMSMLAVDVAEGSKTFRSVDGVLFTLDENGELDALRYYPSARPGEEYTVPEGVKTIDTDWLGGYHLLRMRRLILPTTITSLATGAISTDLMSVHRPGMENQTFASPFDEIYIPSGVEGLQKHCITTYSGIPLKICCEDAEKPASWDDNWCDENCTVEWGVKK